MDYAASDKDELLMMRKRIFKLKRELWMQRIEMSSEYNEAIHEMATQNNELAKKIIELNMKINQMKQLNDCSA